MTNLADKSCVPCSGGVPALKGDDLAAVAKQLETWTVVDEHHIERAFSFDDFKGALAFVNRVGEVAEAEGHHPDIYFTWGKARVKVFTHAIDGLTESDFVLGAKIDRVYT